MTQGLLAPVGAKLAREGGVDGSAYFGYPTRSMSHSLLACAVDLSSTHALMRRRNL
jgi:hypothetical protein